MLLFKLTKNGYEDNKTGFDNVGLLGPWI